MTEYFSSSILNLKMQIGPDFATTLFSQNQREDSHENFSFLDYYPLINARAHRVGGMDCKD